VRIKSVVFKNHESQEIQRATVAGLRQEESSFLKKRSKKLLCLRSLQRSGHGRQPSAGADIKVFCFFSSEKKTFFHLLTYE
jgi:hypothetical protein